MHNNICLLNFNRLIINLTSPILLIYNEQVPTEKLQHSIYQKLISYTQTYMIALTDDRIWATLSNRLSTILKLVSFKNILYTRHVQPMLALYYFCPLFLQDSLDRGEEKEMTIERILVFIRNVLQIPPTENENRAHNDVTVHDEVWERTQYLMI